MGTFPTKWKYNQENLLYHRIIGNERRKPQENFQIQKLVKWTVIAQGRLLIEVRTPPSEMSKEAIVFTRNPTKQFVSPSSPLSIFYLLFPFRSLPSPLSFFHHPSKSELTL
jgi:hypothetical protein